MSGIALDWPSFRRQNVFQHMSYFKSKCVAQCRYKRSHRNIGSARRFLSYERVSSWWRQPSCLWWAPGCECTGRAAVAGVAVAMVMDSASRIVERPPTAAAEVDGTVCFTIMMRSVSRVAVAMRTIFRPAVGRSVSYVGVAVLSGCCLAIDSHRGSGCLVHCGRRRMVGSAVV